MQCYCDAVALQLALPAVLTHRSDVGVSSSGEIKKRLRAAGLRATGARLDVYKLLQKEARPMSHPEVADALKARPWDRTTIYRNLMDMVDAGLLHRVCLGATWHFEGLNSEDRHPHFVCTECGSVECLRGIKLRYSHKSSSLSAVRRGEFQVQLHGICDDCK